MAATEIINHCNYHIIILLAAINVISLAPATQVCLLMLESCNLQFTSNSTTCCYQWPKDTDKLAKSFTELHIHPGVYKLKENLIIKNIKNFTLIGSHTTFNCEEKKRFSLTITNSSYIYLTNVHFINCGESLNKSLGELNHPPLSSTTNTVVYLHTSHSVKITNAVFQDSYSHGIVGLDIVGHSLLQNVTIYQTTINVCCSKKQILTGGIIWLNTKLATQIPMDLIISHCHIQNISDEGIAPLNDYISSAISLYLHQQQCIINMTHVTIANVRIMHAPLVFISTSPLDTTTVVSFSNSNFYNNNVSYVLIMKNSDNSSVPLLMASNTFSGNTVERKVLPLANVIPVFQGYTLFTNNNANFVLSFNKYIVIEEKTRILFTENKPNKVQQTFNQFVIEKWDQASNDCPFQFENLSAHITFCKNTGYYRLVYVQSFLNNCTMRMKDLHKYLPTETLYKYSLHQCQRNNTTQVIRFGREHDICHCNLSNENLHFSPEPIFPGQNVKVNLHHLKSISKMLMYTDTESNLFSDIAPRCELSNPKCDIIHQQCTTLSYTLMSNATSVGQCLILLRTPEYITFVLNISMKNCQLGFSIDPNGICNCHPTLQDVLRGIICNISNQIFKLPPNYWVSSIDNNHDIIYTTHCKFVYCLKSPGFITLDSPDDQCLPTRSGMGCGKCKRGFSKIFGSAKCKRCSNYGIFMIVPFAIAGLVLVLLLFMLDLTVTNGDIYGFVLFVNVVSVNSCKELLTQYVIVALSNLDLGIEVCFYDGMTDYDTIWLQFAFPVYILTLVGGLVVASRYSARIERLTRRKVIPVIATLILLSYNKIMIVTFKGLFSYTTFYYLKSGKSITYWAIDTSIVLFRAKHLLLFIFCAMVFLFVIIPINAMLLFTKRFYHFKFVTQYFKPLI